LEKDDEKLETQPNENGEKVPTDSKDYKDHLEKDNKKLETQPNENGEKKQNEINETQKTFSVKSTMKGINNRKKLKKTFYCIFFYLPVIRNIFFSKSNILEN